MTMQAIHAQCAGGPEVLTLAEVDVPPLGANQVRVEVAYAGVNFIDTYRRAGVYPVPFPHIPGTEGSGVVTEVGAKVTNVAVGDRVAWAELSGSYAQQVVIPAERVLPLPEGLDLARAAALPLQGMTAHYLVDGAYPAQRGDTVVVTAAAGGVGLLLTQLAVARGARVIGTVGTAAKAELAREAGASEVIVLDALGAPAGTEEFTKALSSRIRELTDGEGAHGIYDGIGKDTFDASLLATRMRGTLVLFGGASGQVPPVDLQRLNAGGSLFVTRPTLAHYTHTVEELRYRWEAVAGAATRGELSVRIGAHFPLADSAAAHAALEGRGTTGKVLIEVNPTLA